VLRRSMAVLKIKTGHVTVDGEPWKAMKIEADRLARVAVDGVPLEGGK
jgi:ribosomal 50S subunit-recycling heat shock protein